MTPARFWIVAATSLLAACSGSDTEPSPVSGGAAGAPPVDATSEAPPPVGTTLATVTVSDRSGGAAERKDVWVTFAQPFAPGHVPAGTTVAARLSGTNVPLQVDAKATHADGSLRHAVLTALVPTLPASGSATLELVASTTPLSGEPLAASDLLATPFDATISLTLGGSSYTASARALLSADAGHTWLRGPLVTEWTLASPVHDAAGTAHAQLAARFDVRAYAGAKTVVVSATVENDWAFEKGPQNFTYDASIATDRGQAYAKSGLLHYRQARWRKSFTWGDDPKALVEHDVAYLYATSAVPRFDPAITADEAALASLDGAFSGDAAEPMGIGPVTAYMPETGGRPDIGPLPAWTSLYVISQDPRAKRVTLGTADLAGSFGIHYRDKNTDRPVSLADYPYMTLLGNPGDTVNPATGKSEAFPDCAGDCATPYTPDSAHQPSLAYVPYLLTGDRYYFEELEFWAGYNMLQANPGYREQGKGLVHWDQARGQGWSMRTLGQAAYITPDADPMKAYFVDRLRDNLAWYDAEYPSNPKANVFGYLANGYTIGDDGTLAPWMDDFFTWSIGHLVDLGFDQAKPLRDYKAKFQIARMTDPGTCWILASAYHMAVEDPQTSAFYTSWADIYAATLKNGGYAVTGLACGGPEMATALGLTPGEMVGYSDSAEGYPSNLQPALAVAAESGIPNAQAAWDKFMARSVKPSGYGEEPQFAVVPR
jgi:hypothetical protein